MASGSGRTRWDAASRAWLLAAWVCAAVGTSGIAQADPEWYALGNANIVATTNAAEEDVRALLTDLERFRVFGEAASKVKVPPEALPIRALVFRHVGEYRRYAPALNVAGHVARFEDGTSLIVMPADHGLRMDSIRVVRHELVHVLLQYHPVRFPRWYEEGLAEFYSTVELRETEAVVGMPPRERFRVPLETFSFKRILNDRFDPTAPTVTRGDAYSQYWLLVNYLLTGSPENKAKLERCLLLVNEGVPSLEAFERAFGVEPDRFWHRELRPYARRFRHRAKLLGLPYDASGADLAFERRAVEDAEVQALLERVQALAEGE